MTRSRVIGYLPPLLAGLLLAGVGWSGAAYSQTPIVDFRPQLVVRPSAAKLVSSGGAPQADKYLAGRFSFEQAGMRVELQPKGWPATRAEIAEPRGMTTLRGRAPRSQLTVSVKDDKDARARLLELPKKTKLPLEKGVARLDPGRHELLVQADGYIPKRLSVDLKPGEGREVAMELEAIPGLPSSFAIPSGLPAGISSLPTVELPRIPAGYGASGGQPVYRPPAAYTAPPPVYRAPAYRAPVVRFTPVAPAAQPASAAPVPMFTPIGNTP